MGTLGLKKRSRGRISASDVLLLAQVDATKGPLGNLGHARFKFASSLMMFLITIPPPA